MDAFEILVIILGSLLGVVLILAIAITILWIKLLKKISRAANSLEVFACNLEDLGYDLKNDFKPFKAFTSVVGIIAKLVKKLYN